MRRHRPLLLLAILLILGGVAALYRINRTQQQSRIPPKPRPLPQQLSASAHNWSWSHTVGGRPVVEVRAGDFRQVKEPSHFDLDRVELRIFDKDGSKYSQVRSSKAEFDIAQGMLYSDGEVEITMGVPAEQAPAGRLVFIRTSGATFESKTGKANTDRPASFAFDLGEGKSVGASYDPELHELHLRSQAELIWRGGAKPMKIEAGELVYKERDAAVLLGPWSRLTREHTMLEGGKAVIWLERGIIRRAEAEAARGWDRRNGRQVEYAAARLYLHFSPRGEIEKIDADGNAKVVSTDATSRTTVTAGRLELEFDLASGESELRTARAKGRGVVESEASGEKRLLRSELIELAMRPGGREISSVTTPGPGSLEILPSRPGQRLRTIEGEQIFIAYGPENRMRSFRLTGASTRTESPPVAGKSPAPPALTWSRELHAEFDGSGKLARLEQSGDFRYQEGDRRGRATRAIYEVSRNLITLQGLARLWEPSGSVTADRVFLDEARQEFAADGNVLSVQAPERGGGSSGILADNAPLQAKAGRMASNQRNQVIRYENNVVLWQGPNRVGGEWVEIDRQLRRLTARGRVATQFLEEPATATAGKPGSPEYTVIEARELLYTEEARLAHYRGGVTLVRGHLTVKSWELRAWLAEAGAGSRFEKAVADGSVEVRQAGPERTRKGSAEHAEYYASEEKMVLTGGNPTFADSVQGSTRGRKLTWFANNDRLLVEGGDDRPAVSRLHRK